jgi:hypothetical protein
MTVLLIWLLCVSIWAVLLYFVHRERKLAAELSAKARKAFECASGMLLEAQRSQQESERLLRAAKRMAMSSDKEKFRRCYMVMN